MARELNVLALIKGQESYVFVYDDASRQPLLDVLRDQAADPGMNFSWFDAAVLSEKVKQQAQTAPPEQMLQRPRFDRNAA